jgi:predicted transcriptional regulator
MPMGIVSDKEFDSELSNATGQKIREESNSTPKPQPVTGEVLDMPSKGRGNGNVEVPNGLRRVIGATAIEEGRDSALDLAKQFGISPSSVGAYTSGATSTASYEDKPNQDVIKSTKDRIGKVARGKLMKALRHITDDKLQEAKVGEIAAVAKQMSGVIKDMEPEQPKDNSNSGGPTFIFYSPHFRKEENFEVVYAKD